MKFNRAFLKKILSSGVYGAVSGGITVILTPFLQTKFQLTYINALLITVSIISFSFAIITGLFILFQANSVASK